MAAVMGGEISDAAAVRLLRAKLRLLQEENETAKVAVKAREEHMKKQDGEFKLSVTTCARLEASIRPLQLQADKAQRCCPHPYNHSHISM